MMWFVVFHNDEFDEDALLVAYADGTFWVRFGFQMWDKEYKRCSSAEKYLEKLGYKEVESIITLGRAIPPFIQNGKVIWDKRSVFEI